MFTVLCSMEAEWVWLRVFERLLVWLQQDGSWKCDGSYAMKQERVW